MGSALASDRVIFGSENAGQIVLIHKSQLPPGATRRIHHGISSLICLVHTRFYLQIPNPRTGGIAKTNCVHSACAMVLHFAGQTLLGNDTLSLWLALLSDWLNIYNHIFFLSS